MSADPQPKKTPGRARKFLLGCTLGGAGLLLFLIILALILPTLFPDPQASPTPDSPALTPTLHPYYLTATVTTYHDARRTAFAVARLTPRPTQTPFPTVAPRPEADPMVSMQRIVRRVNADVPVGMTVTWSNMVGYCESLRNIRWDFDRWIDLTVSFAESQTTSFEGQSRWSRHFAAVWIGLEEEGSVQKGCAVFGVR